MPNALLESPRHERMSVAAELAAALHHSRDERGGERGGEQVKHVCPHAKARSHTGTDDGGAAGQSRGAWAAEE